MASELKPGASLSRLSPRVSVLMPTFKHESFVVRAVNSLLTQTFTDWELVVVDDASPDMTLECLQPYLSDPRVHYHRNEKNLGLGSALNIATRHARGEYLAYLPSDDVYFSAHLQTLVKVLDQDPEVFLAYGGVQRGVSWFNQQWCPSGATLRGDDVVGRETEVLAQAPPVNWDEPFKSGNILALAQVMHRRTYEPLAPWTPRSEKVSDTIEADQWRRFLSLGGRFHYTGKVTCQWTQHPYQHHRIIAGAPDHAGFIIGGLPMYRSYYGVPAGEYLNWQPAQGFKVNELERLADVAEHLTSLQPRRAASPNALRILVVGDLGYNPERLLVLEALGHQLAGIWVPKPEIWMGTGPFPWGRIRDIPFQGDWRQQILEFAPDVIYAGLNWQSLSLIEQVLDAEVGVPMVFHFKEGPGFAYTQGLWPALARLLRESQGRIYINDECRQWFDLALGSSTGKEYFIMDGDPPLAAWFNDDFQPKLSAADGEIHTVCVGRWVLLDRWEEFAEAGVHLHLYGDAYHHLADDLISRGVATGYVHLHPTVQPRDWVRTLSRYDAGWLHPIDSDNHGDLQSATWSDLNYPARLSTYAAAGLPWIMVDNAANGSITSVQELADKLGVGVPFSTIAGLGEKLRDRDRVLQLGANMRAQRTQFTFEANVDELVRYFRRVVATHRAT
jgi:glycosyltransferase involved in cell wall biosynthesis